MLSRKILEPDKKNIEDSFRNMSRGRIRELDNFLSKVDEIDGNYSIFLSGEWGRGKTFFVKQLIFKIHRRNSLILENSQKEDVNKQNNTLDIIPFYYVPIYFNAWEYDMDEYPIVGLLTCLIENCGIPTTEDSFYKNALSIMSSILVAAVPAASLSVAIANSIDTFLTDLSNVDNNDALFNLNSREILRKKIKDLIAGITNHYANKTNYQSKIILIIDELDRCRPDNALSVLETTKFLFNIPNLIIIYSVNSEELSKTIQGSFGGYLNGELYLKRFYDELYCLESYDYFYYLTSKEIAPRARIKDVLDILNLLTFRELTHIEEKLLRVFQDDDYDIHPCVHDRLAIFYLVYNELNPNLYLDSTNLKSLDYYKKDSLDLFKKLYSTTDINNLDDYLFESFNLSNYVDLDFGTFEEFWYTIFESTFGSIPVENELIRIRLYILKILSD